MAENSDTPKDIFEEFINSNPNLTFLNGETKPVVRDGIADYVDELIVKYGLLPNNEVRQDLIEVIRQYHDINYRFIPQTQKHYLMILLWDIISKNPRPLTVAWTAFLLGIAFGELVEWEDVDNPPK